MIPRLKPILGLQELQAALQNGRSGDVIRFESEFAALMNQRFAVAFPYGRTGLIYLLKALDLYDKEIICPAYTCVVVPHAIVYSGNKPIFIDCEPGGFNMDLNKVEQAISSKTGAIVATSLFGYPVDLDKLNDIRARHPNIHIIHDCAHSFAVKWKECNVHLEGVAAVFGLNISKLLTSIFGGMVTTDSQTLYSRLKQLCELELKPASWKKRIRRLLYLATVYPTFYEPIYSFINQMERLGLLNRFVKYYDEKQIDMPPDYLERMCNLEARVGVENINRYNFIISDRRATAKYYFDELKKLGTTSETISVPNIKADFIRSEKTQLPPEVKGATYSHFVLLVSDRNRWLREGLAGGIQFGSLIEYNIPEMTVYGGHSPEEFPVSAYYSRSTVNLPMWGGKKIAKKVVDLIYRIQAS